MELLPTEKFDFKSEFSYVIHVHHNQKLWPKHIHKIPDIILDVLIKQTDPEKGIWQAVDIRFKGITYVSVKKHSFRETIEEQGIDRLITDLNRKNREYFADICSKTQSSGRAPCALRAE